MTKLPRPCPRCGRQYDEALLTAAKRGKVRLDPHPTHLCEPHANGDPGAQQSARSGEAS